MKVSEYLAEWLEAQELCVQRSTYESLTVYFNRHLIPYFETLNIELADLKPKHVQAYAKLKLKSGRLDGKQGGLSLVTVRKHISVLKQALNDAVLAEYIPNNPANFVKLPKQKTKVSERTVLMTTAEAQAVLNAFVGHYLYPFVCIAIYYGLRKSEILGLKWGAVNFSTDTIKIRHTVVKSSTIECKDSTKTDASRRTFQLLPEVKEMLLQIRPKNASDDEYILHRADGTPLRPDSTLKSFHRVLHNKGLPQMRIHDLRHSTGSILFDMGWSVEDVREWLGHADIETTLNIYVHYKKDRKILMANTLAGTFAI